MRVIMTHEQADFDALASLLGAYLLDDAAIPVLPRRTNRNVRSFITLYGLELPFVDPRDLPIAAITHVTLVDAQSLVSLKGMSANTHIHVVDHHPKREHLPPEWSVVSMPTGATTTILVELLREASLPLSPIQATLLLLGIYEDTGALTYARTSARDLLAAAFLLEAGASLQIANNFLNHPLTQEQQSLYDRLRSNTQSLKIHGHTIFIACGDAQDVDEELSSVTHKLRDLLDPDALFVLMKTRSGIQMIARSTDDHIDVAEIVARFGGGGHERAAAALIRDQELANVCARLQEILPQTVRPAVTVAQIMSRGPTLLLKDTPIEKANERMHRFGHEGYPVVEEVTTERGKQKRVIGLLTRRGVDRAIGHKYSIPVSEAMEPGSISISPDDSIEALQRLMIESGWGQVPVVDPTSGDITGIVTRTDLLKILAPQPALPERSRLVSRLDSALPGERLAFLKAIAHAATEQHAALYIVGGFVRDLLLERPSLDFDLVLEGDAILLAQALAQRYGGRVTSHTQFGTAKWHLEGSSFSNLDFHHPLESVDLVSARTEFYPHPTSLPTVERGSIKLDLHRRDFTINTLALRLDDRHYGELHDYWGGMNDLRAGVVRVLHSFSFVDDPTRILRAARFEQRFGFSIDQRTLDLLKKALPLISRLSPDRLRHEFDHILGEAIAPKILARLDELEVFDALEPPLHWSAALHEQLTRLSQTPLPDAIWEIDSHLNESHFHRELGYILWLKAQAIEHFNGICKNLKLSARLADQVSAAAALEHDLPRLVGALPSQIVTRLEDVPPLSRYAIYTSTSAADQRQVLEMYASRWRHVQPVTSGHDLRKLGLPPGSFYREILAQLRAAWLDGEITSLDEEKQLLHSIL